jgi:putative DNA primase/helicase
MTTADTTIRRLAMLERGWRLIPLNGKKPHLNGWQNTDADEEAVRSWEIERRTETNTGALTKNMACVDIDILDARAVDAILDLVRQRYADKGKVLTRVGKPPKAAVPFQTGEPFKKIAVLVWPPGEPRPEKDKDLHRVEILCDGQQFVVDGIHPDTGKEYVWSGGEPWSVGRDELPPLTGDEAALLLAEVRALLTNRGWNIVDTKAKAAPNNKTAEAAAEKKPAAPKDHGGEWQKINAAALANLPAWVPALFPSAASYHGGYRISSAALGRDLEEDLSILPEGIKDFGVHDLGDAHEGGRTPIDIVVEHGGRDQAEAAAWLRERLGIKDAKKFIKVVKGRIASIVDQAEGALVAASVPILVRAGLLVQPIVDTFPAKGGGKTEATVLSAVAVENIIYLLNKHAAVFLGWNERKNKFVETDPPVDVAKSLLRKGAWAFPKVSGVICTPTMRPDGTILDRPGYDPATQLWYAPDSYAAIPPLKSEPTRDDAEQAIELYEDLLVNFPFVTDTDKSVALAAILAPILRGAFDVAPMFLFIAHDVSSGKSYLVDLISTIARGRACPVITNVESAEEMEKRLGALVLAGAPMISLDNCSMDIGGDLMCQITERPLINIRILGKSKEPECEWRGTVFATGNNITFTGDMSRRGLRSALDPKVERGELRSFSFDPVARVLANRGAYVAAAITIARAYVTSGDDVKCGTIASYGEWSKVVREPLIWLGRTDPVKSMDAVREADPVRNAVRDLIMFWKTDLKIGVGYTAVDLRDLANAQYPGGGYERPDLRDLLLLQAGTTRGEIETRRLGNWLMAIRGKIHFDHRVELVKEGTRGGNSYALNPVRLV